MKKTKLLSMLLAVLIVLCAVPFTAQAAASVEIIDGERTVFVSSFGRMSFEGKSHDSYKTFPEAFEALGSEGGTIVFSGTASLPTFQDIPGRAGITIRGVGTKSSGNMLDFRGTEEAPVKEVNLTGDLYLDFVNIRLDEGAYILTNGYQLDTVNEFDTYHAERYVADGPNQIIYENPPSVAVGTLEGGTGVIFLNAGTYENIAAGSVLGKAVNGNTYVRIQDGHVTNMVGGNIGDAVMNGSAAMIVDAGVIDNLFVGPVDGTVNGSVTTEIRGGEIASAVFGPGSGATVNGSVVLTLKGGTFGGPITAGAGTVTGKKIAIVSDNASASLAEGAANVTVKISGGYCEPQLSGSEVTGYFLTDVYGIPAKHAVINGETVSADNGIYQLADGVSTVEITTDVTISVNKNANYVAGYEDGTFQPQNNITRAEAITLLARTVTDESIIKGFVKSNYDDVEDGAWYESYIGLFEKLGYLDSISARHGVMILPNQNITRGEFVELIYQISKVSDLPSSMKIKNFSDVDDKYPYSGAIYFAVANNIIAGYEDGTFGPDRNITRAEVVTIVNRFLGREPNGGTGANTFSDIADHWAASQILAACNGENETWITKPAAQSYVLTGSSAAEYIPALHEQAASLDAPAIREGVDIIAEQMKQDILNTPNTLDIYGDKITGTVYYISEKNGSDDNDGLSPETAWKTIAALSKLRFPKAGVAILFERGGVYRGSIGALHGVVYGAYGEGQKPVLMQSKKNYADASLWQETEWPNVWKLNEDLINVGVIAFDHDITDYSSATYDELYGIIKNKNAFGFNGPQDLDGDLQFYSNVEAGLSAPGALYVYSKAGNPGSRFSSIEIGERVNIFNGNPTGTTFDNLSLKFTGAHGIGLGTSKNITVTNSVFSWLGGSVLRLSETGYPTNYGNSVEIYGGCDGYLVENNWMYQIYDTAVTHQRSSSTGDCTQRNIRYLRNLMEYVFWGIEFYNSPPSADQLNGGKDTWKRVTEDYLAAYNVLRMGGYGWGSIVRYRTSQLYSGATLSENHDCAAEYNIFDRATGNLLNLSPLASEVDDKNIYIQTMGRPIGRLKGTDVTCGYDAAQKIADVWGDKNAVVVVIDPVLEPVVLNTPEGLS